MSAEHVVPLDAEHGAEAEAPPEARARALGRYHKWAVLALVAVGTFMTALDASIVNIGLPSIARAFRAPVGGAVEWVIIVYLVVIAGTLLTFGRLSDLVGRKPVWMTGLTRRVSAATSTSIPSSLKIRAIASATSGSSRPASRGPCSTMVTRLPKRRYVCASSRPTYPAPSTIR